MLRKFTYIFTFFISYLSIAFSQSHPFPVKLLLKKTIVGDTLQVDVFVVDTASVSATYNFGNANFVFTIDTNCVYSARQFNYGLPSFRYPMDSAFFGPLLTAPKKYINFYASGIVDTQINVTLTRDYTGTDSSVIALAGGNLPADPDTALLFSVFLKMKSCACADSGFKWKSSVGIITCGDLHYIKDEIGFDYLPSESDSIRIVFPNPKDTTLNLCQAIDLPYFSNRPGSWNYIPELPGGASTLTYPVAFPDDSANVNLHPDVLNTPANTRTDTLILIDPNIAGCQDTALITVNLSSVNIYLPSADTTICRPDTLVFVSDSNSVNNQWTTTPYGVSSSPWFTSFDSLFVPFDSPAIGTFIDTVSLQLGYCYDTVIVTSGKPDPNFSPSNITFCPNEQNVEFIANSSTYSSYLWEIFSPPLASHHNTNTAPRDTIDIGNTAGTFEVKLTVTDNLGCSDTLRQSYSVDNAYILSVRLFLEGPYDKSTFFTMFPSPVVLLDSVYRTDLNANPEGMDSVKMSFQSLGTRYNVPAGAVDVIKIELRSDPNDPASVIDSAYAWLMSDGTIRDFETGTKDSVTFCEPSVGSGVWIVVRHRNHLPIISSQGINPVIGNRINYNFWLPGRTRNENTETKSHSGIRMMIGGNIRDNFTNNEVNAEDFMRVTQDNGNVSGTYHRSDANLDGNVNAADYIIISNNNDELYRSTIDN